ncbi:uncharacterized protein [Erythrolamprus reginae]|uniref:uncharacterized protein n=1 Tax=Erythrolamprus reginae TaxID=121349 RepID=UPI00396CF4F5
MGRPAGLLLLTAATLCWSWGARGQVYYSCGAQFTSWERGLILSPGFPNNYSSGMHCVWRFLIPAKSYLLFEIFDFDVFESISEDPNAWDGYFSLTKNTNKDSSPREEPSEYSSTVFPTKASVDPDLDSTDLIEGLLEATSQNLEWKEFHPSGEPKAVTQSSQFPIQERINDTLMGQGGKQEKEDLLDKIFFAHYPADKENGKGPQNGFGKVVFGEDAALSTMILPVNSSSTPSFSADVCPDDVLYVSDLITFSSRFCGTKSPLNQNMTFGSSLKMVEVIVELITTTDRGRGFAMLFEYKNETTEMTPTNDIKDEEENTMMLVVITGILFFAMVLLSSLCIACRWRLCLKRSSLEVHSDQENQIQNSGIDISELQLVIPCQENENNNHSLGGNSIVASCPGNLEPIIDLDAPPMSAVMGGDEVFIISANPEPGHLSFTSCKMQDKRLTRSVTSPTSVSEWLIPKHPEPGGSQAPNSRGEIHAKGASQKQQAWRARTFHDLLAPFPQLQEQWGHWTNHGPFPKGAKSGGFSTSTPNQPTRIQKVSSTEETEGTSDGSHLEGLTSSRWTPSAQKPQKLTGGPNSRRSQFANPSFDFLTGSPGCGHLRYPEHSKVEASVQSPHLGGKDAPDTALRLKNNPINGSKPKEASVDMDGPKAVFVISEDGDDQQPLVLAEHTNQCVDVLSETNAATCEGGTAERKEQMVELSLEDDPAEEATRSRLGMDLWGSYQVDFQGDSDETYPAGPSQPESLARFNSTTSPNMLF